MPNASFIITGSLFVVMLAAFIIVLVKLFDKAKTNFALEKENINKDFEAQLLKAQLEIQEQTLQNISQEIHDNIGQALTFVKLNINTIDVRKTDETIFKLQESKQLISQTIQDLRNLSKTLNSGFIHEAGLYTSIEYQILFLKKTGIYTTELKSSGDSFSFPPFVEIVLFRIVQELLNNIVKHAEATVIKVLLHYSEECLTLRVIDNGKGFGDGSLPIPLTGIGLKNIKNRVDMIKGRIYVNSKHGEGTEISIEVPKD